MKYVKKLLKESKEHRISHIDLSEPCLERGGNSTNHKGVLAQYLDTDIPHKFCDLCHLCNNGKCSNPKHLYWGTRKENVEDHKNSGTWKSGYVKCIEKYGEDYIKENMRKHMLGNKYSLGNRKPKTEEHKKKISETLKQKYKNGEAFGKFKGFT